MYHRQPCVADDSYQLSYEHLRQLECAGHFRGSTEVSAFKFVSAKEEVSESSSGTVAAKNGKRLWSHFWDEVVNKRARHGNQTANLEHFEGNSSISILPEGKLSEEAEWTRTAAVVGANESFEEGYEVDRQIAGWDRLEDACFQISDHSHWRHVPVGPDHQADLPEWTSRDSNITSGNATTSYVNHDEASDKWLGTRITAMPDHDSLAMEVQSCYPMIGCDCANEGSIKCVRKHVMDSREKLIRALGQEEFIQMGFSHMGETVAQRWTEEEENLFHEVVSSNPESLDRNFWVVLQKAFPSSSLKELISYYFNVFMLRRRAHQNRFDRSNVDSDNDEWQEGSAEFAEEGEEEEANSDHTSGNGDSIPPKISYVRTTDKVIDSLPTSLGKDSRVGPAFS